MTPGVRTILPGATIGMVGGGQLGRMFALAAASLGYDVVVLCEDDDEPAAQVAHRLVVGRLNDPKAVDRFASQCDVITLEFENIPADTIARCSHWTPTFPAASVLATAQDRWLEKTTLSGAGLPVTPFASVRDALMLNHAAASLGWPLIVKTMRSGYDGKGQYRIESPADAGNVPWGDFDGWIAEQCIHFDCEVSVIVARTPQGCCECFPVFENAHRHHILDVSIAPALLPPSVAEEVCRVAKRAAQTLGVVGLLCVEFFVCNEQVMINEVAPRPHNSGHLTIEACHTSQFEQHVRAICNLPLGSTAMRCGAAVMVNLLGDLWDASGRPPQWDKVLADPAVHLHLYGKRVAKVGRKMGHLTVTGQDRDEPRQRALHARSQLEACG